MRWKFTRSNFGGLYFLPFLLKRLPPTPLGECRKRVQVTDPRVQEPIAGAVTEFATGTEPLSRQYPQVTTSALEPAVRAVLRIEHYTMKTEKAYLHWIRRFVAYYSGKHPSDNKWPQIH